MHSIKCVGFIVIAFVLFAPLFSMAEDELDCALCHQNPMMMLSLKNEFGVSRKLYIDPTTFEESYHYILGGKTECVLCHENITKFPHERTEPVKCSSCHEVGLFKDIEKNVSASVHNKLGCNDCHDVHTNKPAVAMTLEEKNSGCLNCHQYGLGARSSFKPIEIDVAHTWHPLAGLHIDRMACIVCHTNISEGHEADKHLIRDRSHATRECSVCHSGDSKVAQYLIDIGPKSKLGVSTDDMLIRIYLVGGTRNKWIEIIGGSTLTLTMLLAFVHGMLRIILGRRSR